MSLCVLKGDERKNIESRLPEIFAAFVWISVDHNSG
jgi:hypothetical protein